MIKVESRFLDDDCYYSTGDFGVVTAEGGLCLKGRQRDTIRTRWADGFFGRDRGSGTDE